jgi:O-antigen biosynthesis protein
MKVSCIMPTKNRAHLIGMAIQCFLEQDYADRELVILDNGDDGTENLIPADARIRYSKVDGERTTGEMRNLCCELAQGEIICHWDSDDWCAPTRISEQVKRLLDSGKQVTGYCSVLFWDLNGSKGYRYFSEPHFTLGTTQCYFRKYWEKHRFVHKKVGEDSDFGHKAHRAKELTTADARALIVCLAHDENTSAKPLNSTIYMPVQRDSIPGEFLAAIQGFSA